MSKRFTRNVDVEKLSEQESMPAISELIFELNQFIDHHFAHEDWEIEENDCIQDNSLVDLTFRKSTFQGKLNIKKSIDLINEPGQGSRRKLFVPVAAECANVKRKKGRETESAIQHNTMMIFGTILGVVFAAAGAIAEALILERIHIFFVVFLFGVGAAIGGGIGAVIGNMIGKTANTAISKTNEDEESAFQHAMQEWELFIDTLITRVDHFAQQVEITPTSATVS